MFEGTLVESRRLAGTGTARWTALGSVVLQCAVAGLLVAIPLLHPEVLPILPDAPRLTVPVPAPPPLQVVRVESASARSSTLSTPAQSMAAATSATLRFVFPQPGTATDGNAPDMVTNLRMGDGGASALIGVTTAAASPTVVVPTGRKAGPVRVSSGVSAGMLLSEIRPVYPRIAVAARVEGAVVMEAVISKAGRIESLRAVSGPAMLRGAALDAVQAARYEPYRLNGEATEVETTITVNFRLGS